MIAPRPGPGADPAATSPLEPATEEPPLDLAFVRERFPGLSGDELLMDAAGGSQTLAGVADRARDYLLHSDVQLGASYARSRLAGRRVAEGRARLAEMLGAEAEEIVLGGSTTLLLQRLARALAPGFEPGDEIVLTRVDHESNIGPWLGLEAQGIRIRIWPLNPESGALEIEDLRPLLGPRTRLVAAGHVSNVLGAIQPVREMAELAREAGALLAVDGVAYAPHGELDLGALGADFYALSLYKVYGPHQAVLFAARRAHGRLYSQNHYFIPGTEMPSILEPGNPNYELAWASGAIPDYLEELGGRRTPGSRGAEARASAWAGIAAQEERLQTRLLAALAPRDDLRILGPRSPSRRERVPTISFVHEHLASSAIVQSLDAQGIGVRYGHFYARRLVEDLGLPPEEGVVRISLLHYHTLAEVERLLEALLPILDGDA